MENSTVRIAGLLLVILLAGIPARANDTAPLSDAGAPASDTTALPASDTGAPPPSAASAPQSSGDSARQPVPFPKELLGTPEYVELGHEVFNKICKFCHGKAAYPGKAPKLNPARYTPEFVFDRVTKGFRGMPSFKEQFSDKERQGVTVFIMSPEFSN